MKLLVFIPHTMVLLMMMTMPMIEGGLMTMMMMMTMPMIEGGLERRKCDLLCHNCRGTISCPLRQSIL